MVLLVDDPVLEGHVVSQAEVQECPHRRLGIGTVDIHPGSQEGATRVSRTIRSGLVVVRQRIGIGLAIGSEVVLVDGATTVGNSTDTV